MNDRDAFGHWLSGFTDGEGSFMLHLPMRKDTQRRVPQAIFTIQLRVDDICILEGIKLFFGVGLVETRKSRGNINAAARYNVRSILDLHNVIVPHFEKYPLRAKKQRDFLLWKSGVDFLFSIYVLGCKGCKVKWTEKSIDKFSIISDALKEQRSFESSGVTIPLPVPKPTSNETQCQLFDAEAS